MSDAEAFLMESILDGQESGMELAADFLESVKGSVALENQTWDSAIAMIRLLLRDAKRDRK